MDYLVLMAHYGNTPDMDEKNITFPNPKCERVCPPIAPDHPTSSIHPP